MFGEQHDSRKPSAPVFGFGSSDRKALERVFISTDHNKADFGKLGPGHIYDVTPGFGKQVSSKNVNPPSFSFGTASRFLKPSAERAKRNPQVPGPGAYAAQSSIGKTVNSNHVTEAAFGFGTSTRDHAAKVFLSSEQAKVFFGLESPGPAAYRVMSGMGTQQKQPKPNRARVHRPQTTSSHHRDGPETRAWPRAILDGGICRAPGGLGHGDEADGGLRERHEGPRRESVPGPGAGEGVLRDGVSGTGGDRAAGVRGDGADGGLDEENRANRLLRQIDPRVVRHKRQPGTGGVRLKRRDGRREAPGCDAKWNQGTLGTHRIDPAALHLSSPATEVRWFDGLVWLVEPVGDEHVRGGGTFLRAVSVPRDDTDGVWEDGRPGFVRSISDHIVEVPQGLQDREHLEPGRLPLLPSCQATDIISSPRTTPPSPTAARLDV